MRKYHTLVGISKTHHAEIIFGDYDRATVKYEMDEYRYKDRINKPDVAYLKYAILTTYTANKADIEGAVKDYELQHRQSLSL